MALTRTHYKMPDYIGWVTRAKQEDTREKRLAQMLEELEGGKRYMNMVWKKRLSRF